MGCVQQAVLEFDEEVQAPWRPRLVADPDAAPAAVRPTSRRAPSRVGVCEPAANDVLPVRRLGAGAVDRSPGAARAGSVPSPSASRPAGRSARRATARRSPGRRSPGRLRLTQRARRLAFVLAVSIGVALGSWLDSLFGGAGELRLAGESSVVVRSGDTLWSIASSVAGDDDVRAVVHAIQRANGLHGADLVPGQVLLLP